ncbi:hypothetical protein OsJ_25854 [Oryza sativa Japonica Group]|uniref:Uncharacterized protein n=1 Tax=Oryza sativa subsp. japonica TaxID=39947 RepID=B9FYT8_ORYSJ|nr:hypothetical protein OsJ_25854 [Oryza sativa Japonica Group]
MPPLPLSRPLAPLGGVSDLTSKVSGEEQGQRMWQGGEGLSSRRSTVLDNTPTSKHSLDDRRPLISKQPIYGLWLLLDLLTSLAGVRKSNVRSTIKGKDVLHVRTLELLA